MPQHKTVRTFLMGMTLCAAGQNPNGSALHFLTHDHPSVRWDEKSARVADVTCDGTPDTVVFGSESAKVWVGVVSPKHERNPQLLSFPLATHSQDSFCAVPVRIELEPFDCDADGEKLPGCKPVKSCRTFSVADDECDSFHFYWDSARRTIRWWRR
jgi:hypothetical protein